ncbi:MAG: YbaN family protein [Bacteroidales bacterium]|nr:YbaN family protein [Bacteroidales bacterium]
MLKGIYLVLGTLSLGLGITGIFIPGLPTTPFILLTAGLYIRSSDKLYSRLVNNHYIGSYISEFQKKKGLTLKVKIYSIILMWAMIFVSVTLLIRPGYVKILVLVTGIIGTVVMGYILPTISKN